MATDISALGSAEADRVKELLTRYPEKKSAVMPALYIAQEKIGWLPEEAVAWVARQLDLSPAHVRGVASFYTMYYKRPVGRYHFQVCRTLSCMICGARKLTALLKKRLALAPGEVSEDGLWSYEEVECLGSCGTAPMVQINDVFFENLTEDSLAALVDRIEREKPDLRYSGSKEALGDGFPDRTRSEAWKSS